MEMSVVGGREEKDVAREGTKEAKRACRFEMCFWRRAEMWVVKRWIWWLMGRGELVNRGSVLSCVSEESHVAYKYVETGMLVVSVGLWMRNSLTNGSRIASVSIVLQKSGEKVRRIEA